MAGGSQKSSSQGSDTFGHEESFESSSQTVSSTGSESPCSNVLSSSLPSVPNTHSSIQTHFTSSSNSASQRSHTSFARNENPFAHSSYTDDINFVRNQKNFFNAPSALENKQENVTEFEVPNTILGHRITGQLSNNGGTGVLVFQGVHEITGEHAIFKISPEIKYTNHLARFLNDWYVTSGRHPASTDRLWTVVDSGTMCSRSNVPLRPSSCPHAFTLPKELPGILYPEKEFTLELNNSGSLSHSIGVMYPDPGLETIASYYFRKTRESSSDIMSSKPGSLFSGLSDLSHSISSSRTGGSGENSDYVELSNKVKQIPKSSSLIIEIIEDIIQVLRTLSICHSLGITHNGIASHCILRSKAKFSDKSKRPDVYLFNWDFNFSVACEDSSGSFRNKSLDEIQNIIHYISPESTGGTSTIVDYRSDLYSIGVVLYELIVGCLPFRSDNLLALRNIVINQVPIQPIVLGPKWISDDLNYVIMRCLEKSPGDRYESADHLIHDLKLVIKSYSQPPVRGMGIFEFKSLVSRTSFALPLFHSTVSNVNNATIRKQLTALYNESKQTEVILLRGDFGVGKSVILEHLSGVALNQQGFVIHWRYFFEDNSISKYASVMYGVYSATKQILASSDESIEEWRHLLHTEIDADLSLLFGAVPNLEKLLGPHYHGFGKTNLDTNLESYRGPLSPTSVDEGSPIDDGTKKFTSREVDNTNFGSEELNTELKYIYIFKKFFSLLAQKGLTLILDNVDSCPSGDFGLMNEALEFCHRSNETSNVKVIVSINNEIECKELTDTKVKKIKQLAESYNWPLREFDINSLSPAEFVLFMNLFSDSSEDKELAKSLHVVTKGNLLYFNYLIRCARLTGKSDLSVWGRVKEIINENQLHSFKDLMQMYIDCSLATLEAISILKYAAIICANGFFTMANLMIVTGISFEKLNKLLHCCLESRLIVPTGVGYKIPFHLIAKNELPYEIDDSTVWEFTTKARFRFDHDFLRRFVIDDMKQSKEFAEYHKLCGLRLKRKILKEATSNVTQYLVMASHLYQSLDAALPQDYKFYCEALINGGRFAISISNVSTALKYFVAAERFIAKDDKRRRLKILLTRIQCNYLMKNFKESIKLIELAQNEFGEDNLTLMHLKVCSFFNLNEYHTGIDLAIQGLKQLDVEVSNNPDSMESISNRLLFQLPLSVSEIRSLKSLKKATKKQFLLVASLISDMLSATYLLDLKYLRLALLSQVVSLMRVHGYSVSCAIPLLHLANYFLQPSEHMSSLKAVELADVALSLVNGHKGASTSSTQIINECYRAFFAHFKQPIPKILKSAVLFDNPEQAVAQSFFTKNWIVVCSMFLGAMRGWTSSQASLRKEVLLSNDIERTTFDHFVKLWRQSVSLDDYLEHFKSVSSQLSPDIKFVALANAVINASSMQRIELACKLILNGAYDVSKKVPVSIMHIWFYFMSAICLLNSTNEETENERSALVREIMFHFRVWSTTSYINYGSEMKLLDACVLSLEAGESQLSVLDLFEEAIEDAEKQQNWQGVALANRLCAKWLSRVSKSKKRAVGYASKAYALYSTMNSLSQAKAIKNEFPEISSGFNWAGIRNMISPSEPLMENKSLFAGPLLPMTRGVFRKEESLEKTDSIASDTSSIPKSDDVRAIETSTSKEPSHYEWTEVIALCLTISQSSSIDLIVQTLLESTLSFAGVDYGSVILNFQSDEPLIRSIGTSNGIYLLEGESLVARTDLVPSTLVLDCLIKGEIICMDKERIEHEGPHADNYFDSSSFQSCLCVPIKTSTVIGVLYLESHIRKGAPKLHFPLIDSTKIDLLYLLCSQAAVSFSKSVVYSQMELAKKTAEEATEQKASFLANMSHEIRTPFNSLFACSIFLLDTPLDSVQKEYVETIKDSALITLNIIDGILAFTKIEHGSFNLEVESFSINETIEGAISFSSDKTELGELEFAYFNKCPQIEKIVGDSTRIRQIIINLVGNALKFTEKGYVKVVLDATAIHDNRYELQLIVEDTGIGIPEDSITQVFGAFSQVDGSSRRVYGGSGLGLAISNKLAELMNGKILVTSEVGKGSTFTFKCPFEVEMEKSPPKIRQRNVCIISGSVLKKQALREIMEYYGATVMTYESLESFDSSTSYDMILIDKVLLREGIKLRSYVHSHHTLIYILTRFGSVLSDKELLQVEADSMFFSPFKRKSVRRLLEDEFQWRATANATFTSRVSSLPSTGATQNTNNDGPAFSILLAEDNPVNLRVASQYLEKLGYKADHAKDGQEALEMCEQKLKEGAMYDIIFMDIQMPRKDGIQATVELKKSFKDQGLKTTFPYIIALTANVASEERTKCLESGMLDFISKPILPIKLKDALEKVKQKLERKHEGETRE